MDVTLTQQLELLKKHLRTDPAPRPTRFIPRRRSSPLEELCGLTLEPPLQLVRSEEK